MPKPAGAVWRRVRDIAPSDIALNCQVARANAANWASVRTKLENPEIDRRSMDIWVKEQSRAFAIETGQIEGLYLLKRGVTETLITEGLESASGIFSAIDIEDNALRGLLTDQECAMQMMFSNVKEERDLTEAAIKEWHALFTRHQDHAVGIDQFGNRVNVPLLKGTYKIRSNNPRQSRGTIYEYCPPEHVASEMEQFLEFHHGHRELNLAPELEAAWLHYEFVRIHPFQDGNGRVSRLLMAYAYAKAGEFPPLIATANKSDYIGVLEAADAGQFQVLVEYLGQLAAQRSAAATRRAEAILAGRIHYRHSNGGITVNGVYYPPEQ